MNLKDEEGASLAEFGLGFAILSMSMFGIIAFCGAMYSCVFVSEAAREASRYVMVRGSACTGFSDCNINTSAPVNTYVQNHLYPGIRRANVTATAAWSGSNSPSNAPGNFVTVTVNYNFPMAIPFWPKAGSILHLTSSSQMAISQ
jgi:Flp pilus assembly protein TadG